MRHWSCVTALGVASFAIAGPARAATISLYLQYGASAPCGQTLGCLTVQYGVPGSCELDSKFIDALGIPAGARVTGVTVRIHGWQSGTGVEVTPTIQGESVATMVDALPSNPVCDCQQTPVCAATAFSSASYPNGWPGWNYVEPGSNRLDLEVTAPSGGIVVDAVTVDIEYQYCGNSITEVGETCDDGDADWCDGCTPTCEVTPVCPGGCNPSTGCVSASVPAMGLRATLLLAALLGGLVYSGAYRRPKGQPLVLLTGWNRDPG